MFFVAFFAGCASTDRSSAEAEKAINQVMSIREKAIREKDIDLYMTCISKDYKDREDSFDVVRERMQKNFEVFEMIDFLTSKRTVYLEGQKAMLVEDYEIVFFAGAKRDRARGKEQIFLRKEDGGWKIVKGL